LLEAIRETLHVGQFSFVLTSRHQIIEFACSIAVQFLPPARNDALPAGKSFSSDTGNRTELPRYLAGARSASNRGVDLSARIDVREIPALVLFLKRQIKTWIDYLRGVALHKNFSG
jgi:hypothetical protein